MHLAGARRVAEIARKCDATPEAMYLALAAENARQPKVFWRRNSVLASS